MTVQKRRLAAVGAVLVALSLASAPSLAVASPGTWSKPVRVAAGLGALSCASPAFCVATSATRRAIVTFNGTAWSQPQPVPTSANPTSVSCPTATFCMLVADSGSVLTFDGTHWAPSPQQPPQPLAGVSCTSPTFCLGATDSGPTFAYDGTGWTQQAPSSEALRGIQCASATKCIAIAGSAPALFDGRSWRVVSIPHEWAATQAVTCAAVDLCEAVDYLGAFYAYTDGTWVPFGYAFGGGGNGAHSISCGSVTLCAIGTPRLGVAAEFGVNVDGVGVFDFVRPTRKNLNIAVSCVPNFCGAVDRSGLASTTTYPANYIRSIIPSNVLATIESYENAMFAGGFVNLPGILAVDASMSATSLRIDGSCPRGPLQGYTLVRQTEDSKKRVDRWCPDRGKPGLVVRTPKHKLETVLAPYRNYRPLLTVLGDAAAQLAHVREPHASASYVHATKTELLVRYSAGPAGYLKQLDLRVRNHHLTSAKADY
jgi:hypothetical protein